MLTYISRVKSASLQLASVGEVVSRTVRFNTIISGLGDQFEAVKVYLAVDPALREERLSQVSLAEESRLLAYRSDRDLDRGRQRYPRDRDRSISPNQRPRSPRYRSPYQHGRGSRYCPTCNMYGHDESTCYRLHPDLLARRRAAQPPPRPFQSRAQYRPSAARLGGSEISIMGTNIGLLLPSFDLHQVPLHIRCNPLPIRLALPQHTLRVMLYQFSWMMRLCGTIIITLLSLAMVTPPLLPLMHFIAIILPLRRVSLVGLLKPCPLYLALPVSRALLLSLVTMFLFPNQVNGQLIAAVLITLPVLGISFPIIANVLSKRF